MPRDEARPANGLNDQQREAVEFGGRPLIVLAGPGTGKTRVITERVARIIRDGAPPETVVAVTFTIKAARELRERLRGLVGPGAADRVNAHTFHGFGHRLVRRFGDYLGLPAEPRLMDSAQSRRLVRSLIRRHGLFPELVASGRDRVIGEALGTMEAFANSAVFPDRAVAFAGEWRRRIEANAGLGGESLDAEAERQRRFAQMAELYRLFEEACTAGAAMTFDHLILWPIRLLRERPAAAAMVRDDHRHVVVDEFQDVNLAQIELLRLLCPPRRARGGEPPAGPDLCVVGDDDQSIYEFRGADDRAFAHFSQVWPGAHVVSLSQNYRSTGAVIEAANAIMARAEHRFAPDKVVELPEGRRAEPAAPGAGVECLTVDHDDRAGEVIAAMILDDLTADPSRPLTEIAVIARTHADLDRIGSALQLEGIPVRLARGRSALDDLGVRDVLRWIELLVTPPGDDAATHSTHWLLTRPPYSVPAALMVEWAQAYRAENSRQRFDPSAPAAPPLADWLLSRHREHEVAGAALARFYALAGELRAVICHCAADAAVFEIIRRADVAHAELLAARDRARRVGHLAEIIRFVSSRVGALDPPADLGAFWSYYNDLSDEERRFREQGEDRIDGDADADDDAQAPAVMLLTAHSAKGLEFDTVFVPRARPPFGYPKTNGGERDELPADLLERTDDGRSVKERALAEERRLFYVACTRAKRRLVVLAKRAKKRGEATDFFNELTLDAPCCAFVKREDAAEVLAAASARGVRLSTGSALDDAGSGLGAANRAELLRSARQEARLLAANALDTADRADLDGPALDSAASALRDAAERIGIAAHLERSGQLPAWLAHSSAAVRAYAGRLAAAHAAGRLDRPFEATLFRPLSAPLHLSFSWIKEYHDCPRCFYLRRVMRVPEPAGEAQLVGIVAHGALAAFYDGHRRAEAEGTRPPSLDDLLRLGREHFLAHLPARSVVDEEQLNQVLAQLRLVHERLHDARDEIEQIEFSIRFPYPRGGAVHQLEAKIDRLDRAPPLFGGHRIIDYKTGRATKRFLEPSNSDLQLGIYAMALRWHQQGGASPDEPAPDQGESELLVPARGLAEYWVLSTGERGRIDLGEIDYASIKGTIDGAVDGMLAGRYDAGPRCWKLCQVFARSDPGTE